MSRENDGFEFRPGLLQRFLDVLYRVIDLFIRWDRLPTLIAAVNLGVFRDRLRAHNLHHTGLRHYSGAARCAAGMLYSCATRSRSRCRQPVITIRAPDSLTEALPAMLEFPRQQCIKRAVSSDQHGMFEAPRSGTA